VQLLAGGVNAQADGRYGVARDHYAQARAAKTAEVGSPPSFRIELVELFCRAQLDDLDGALKRLDEVLTEGEPWLAPRASVLRARLHLAAGHLLDATDAAMTALRWALQFHDHAAEAVARQVLALAALYRGQLSEAREHGGSDDGVRALLAIADGDTAAAARLLVVPLDFPERTELLVHAAVIDPASAEAARDLLAEQADATPATGFRGAAQLVAAYNEQDRAGLAKAVEFLRETPRPLLLARAEELYGKAELEQGDRATGVATLERALDSYTAQGATSPAARVQAVLQAAGVRRRRWAAVQHRPDTGWEALTPMERRVALLVAEGHTNRSAAEELVLSASTVGTHLRAAFGKLGVNSRVQLTRLVLERFASPPNA
jgi:DNA-binding CsgD family transcriptional regulator